ncbi:MAG: hypothetical protein ACOCV2_06025, partial [Persicimonas sp.]
GRFWRRPKQAALVESDDRKKAVVCTGAISSKFSRGCLAQVVEKAGDERWVAPARRGWFDAAETSPFTDGLDPARIRSIVGYTTKLVE